MSGRSRNPSPRRSHPSKALLVAGAAAALVFLYGVYTWMGSGSVAKTSAVRGSGGHLERFHTWKTRSFVDIPPEVLSRAKDAKIEERTLSFNVDGLALTVFFREVGATRTGSSSGGFSILLLHGAYSSSDVWVKTKTLHLLAALGYRTIAVDLPGWAQSKNSKLEKYQFANFLQRFIEQEKLGRPVIVSPSMSGSYAIPFMMQPEPSSCHERMRAYVPLAPVSTELYKDSEYHRCEIPVMIVYGTKDKTLGLTSVGHLRNMPNSEIFPMEGAGHANYEERPHEWNRLFYNFLLALKSEAE